MAFITASDNTGSISLTIFPDLYKEENSFKKNEIIHVLGILFLKINVVNFPLLNLKNSQIHRI